MTRDRDRSATASCCPTMFEDALRRALDGELAIRALELPWPDEPMRHGYAGDSAAISTG